MLVGRDGTHAQWWDDRNLLFVFFFNHKVEIAHLFPLSDLKNNNTALHQERITHMFTDTDGIRNPHGLPEDVQHKLLESDLSLQMGLLKDKLATEHMQEESMEAYGFNPYTSTMNLPIMDGTLDEEISEAVMICLAIAALAILPQFI